MSTECFRAWSDLIGVNNWLLGAAYPASPEAIDNLQLLASAIEASSDESGDPYLEELRRLIRDREPVAEIRAVHEVWFWRMLDRWTDSHTVEDREMPAGFAGRRPKPEVPEILVRWHAAIDDRGEDIILVRGGAFPGDGGDEPAKERTAELAREMMSPVQIIAHCDPERDFSGLDLQDARFMFLNAPGASFDNANLAGARFVGGDLSSATFSRADLSYTVYTDVTLRDARFSDTDVSRLYFSRSDLSGASFEGASGLSEVSWDAESLCPDGSPAQAPRGCEVLDG